MFDINVDTGITKYVVSNCGGETQFDMNGEGIVRINDLAHRKMGTNNASWGICITFHDRVWEMRYEGLGALNLAYNRTNKVLTVTASNGAVTEITH